MKDKGRFCVFSRQDREPSPVLFGTICDVEKALELAAQELNEKYRIDVQLEKIEETEVDELTNNQLSFFLIRPPIVLPNAA